MKYINYKYRNSICVLTTLVIATFMLGGCESNFLDKVPTDAVSSGNVWTTSNLATKVVTGVYSALADEYSGTETFPTPETGKICWDSYSSVMDLDRNWISGTSILTGKATPSSSEFAVEWRHFYEGISRANDVIANISKVPDMSDVDKGRYIAECKFLRAWFYMRLNILWKGVPLYLEPVSVDQCTKGRSTEAEVWDAIVKDLTDCINEKNLPDKYGSGDTNYGHITKGAAYALRGKVYLWLGKYAEAEQDFIAVTKMGYSLYTDYKTLFKESNERCDEMIFSIQYIDESGLGEMKNQLYGNRTTDGSAWNNYIPNPHYVDSYECVNGKPFNYNDFLPGYSSMSPQQRSVFFLRNNLNADEIKTMTNYGADMSKYLPNGNEARIKACYDCRDPRLEGSIITPYSTYLGGVTGTPIYYTLRWPYRGADNAAPYDLRTDTNSKFYYLWRKFVYEGTEHTDLFNSPIDIPVIRYADVLLGLAEALNEQGKTDEAITYINMVRARAGVALLNSNEYTQITGQDDMRQRIRNEYYWELGGEDNLYFDELRWKTWKDKKFAQGNGMTEIWGTATYTYSWGGDQCWKWAIPESEIEKNSNLTQNDGYK